MIKTADDAGTGYGVGSLKNCTEKPQDKSK